jgi:hypothetical protein
MSAVVAYGFDDFAVVATDTRVYHGDRYRDDADKLWSLNEGWAAGVGYDAILKSVFQELPRSDRYLGESLARAERVWNVGSSTLLPRFPDARQQIEGSTLVATMPRSEPGGHRWIVVSKEGARVIESRSVVLPEKLAPHVPTYPHELDHPRLGFEFRVLAAVRATAAFLDVASRHNSSIGPTADIGVSFVWDSPIFRPALRFRGPAGKIARSGDERLKAYVEGGSRVAGWSLDPPMQKRPREWVPRSLIVEWIRQIPDEER